MATISGTNHNGARDEWRQRQEETRQTIHQAIAALQEKFAGVKDPTERRILTGVKNGGVEVKITPKEIIDESMSTINFRPTAEGGPNDFSGVSERTGETWTATIIPETGSVTFQRVDARGGHLSGLQLLRYVPQHEVPQDENGSASSKIEPATASIVVEAEGIRQELVFRAPVTEPLPTASHPS